MFQDFHRTLDNLCGFRASACPLDYGTQLGLVGNDTSFLQLVDEPNLRETEFSEFLTDKFSFFLQGFDLLSLFL